MFRSGSPALLAQEIPAWAAGVEMTRGVTRDAAIAAQPAGKGAAPGSPSAPATCPWPAPAAPSSPRSAPDRPAPALTSKIAKYRTVGDRDRHRARKSKSPSTFGHAGVKNPSPASPRP